MRQMENSDQGWQELKTESGPKCPRLFYKFTASVDGFELYLTDLIAIWLAQASSQDVRDYAQITRTSIDPTDAAQLRVLLEKLSQSLASGSNVLRRDSENENEALLLSTTLKLPRPLQPLKWEFYLESQGATAIAEILLRPCLHEASEARRKIDDLSDRLVAKDRVISKLLEKIEASSLDLSLIFPGISGARARKGQVTVDEAKKHVPGLSEFKRDIWSQSHESDSPYASFESKGLYKLIKGNEKCPKHTPEQHHKWFLKLSKLSVTASQAAALQNLRSSSPIIHHSESEDEFETQRKRERRSESTDIESGAPKITDTPQRAIQHQNQADLSGPNTNHAKQRSRSSSPVGLPPAKHENSASAHDSDVTESESEVDLDAAPKSKPSARIGRLGNKTRPPSQNLPTHPSKSSPPQTSSPAPNQPIASSPPSSPLPQPPQTRSHRVTYSRRDSVSSTASSGSDSHELQLDKSKPQLKSSLKPGLLKSHLSKTSETAVQNSNTNPPGSPPKHRLGRLGARGFHSANTELQSPSKSRGTTSAVTRHDKVVPGEESDASTTSTSSPVSINPARDALKRDDSNGSVSRSRSGSLAIGSEAKIAKREQSPEPEPESEPEPEPELTKEEKANRRREELKRKINQPHKTANGTGGVRKKRKF